MSNTNNGLCNKSKCGEYNMLICISNKGHSGECCFVIDHKNDYPWNKNKKKGDK